MPLPTYILNAHTRPADFLLNRRGRLDLDAPYQRASVWDLARRQNLIRSLLMGLPVGAIILNVRAHGVPKYLAVVDGKQRIETLHAMADGEFGVPAEWVEERFQGPLVDIQFEGRTVPGVVVDGIDHPFCSLLNNFMMSTVEATVPTVEAEAEIFLLINSGGVVQTAETMQAATAIADA